MTKPETNEYAPYYEKYISLVPGDDITATLAAQVENTLALLRTIPENKGLHAYAPGKWTIKQMLGHVIDTERIMAYRALCIGRGDRTPFPGFEQDDYVMNTDFNLRTLAELTEEFAQVRQANLHLFKHFSDAEWRRLGTASDNPVSARALAYIIAGHELYHGALLREKYLAE
jgi:hypothetical protein